MEVRAAQRRHCCSLLYVLAWLPSYWLFCSFDSSINCAFCLWAILPACGIEHTCYHSAISSARYPFSSWKELMPISSNRLTTVGPTPLTAKRASFSCLLKPISKPLLRHITPAARAAMEPRSGGISANKGRATARLRECAFALAILISLVVILA